MSCLAGSCGVCEIAVDTEGGAADTEGGAADTGGDIASPAKEPILVEESGF